MKYGINRLLKCCEIAAIDKHVILIDTAGLIVTIDTVLDELAAEIEACFPDAYRALDNLYTESRLNRQYHKLRIVRRFVRCNFSPIDNKPDISDGHFCNFEYVPCPLRGECKLERVVCNPKFKPSLRRSEMNVMRKWYEGLNEDEIADTLHISTHTVHNHIRNAYSRLGVHSRSEFVKYAATHNIFS